MALQESTVNRGDVPEETCLVGYADDVAVLVAALYTEQA